MVEIVKLTLRTYNFESFRKIPGFGFIFFPCGFRIWNSFLSRKPSFYIIRKTIHARKALIP